MSSTTGTGRLSDGQIAQYERDGYVLYNQPVFADDKFARMKAIFEEDLTKFGDEALDVIHFHDDRLLEFLLADELLDLVEPVVGPNIGLWSSHFISKAPRTGKATPWHEDSAFWDGRISTMAGICTVWLAIDEATPENGSMGVIPGSHGNGFSAYQEVDPSKNIFSLEIKPELLDPSKTVFFSLKPNECSLHEARIIHGANANTSDKRRAGYTMRYFPTTSQVYADLPANQGHKLWLARGKDIAGNTFVNA